MTDINFGYLAQLAERALKAEEDGHEYMLSEINDAMREAYVKYPEDIVIRAVASTIEKMAAKSSPLTTISQKQISDIYNNLVTLSSKSKFREVFGDLLMYKMPETKINDKFIKANRVVETAHDDSANKNLVNVFASLFDKNIELKPYDVELANTGLNYVRAELLSLGLKFANVSFLGGNFNTLVYGADFETNRGKLTIAVPIELNNNKLLLPSTFIADDKFAELNYNNVNNFIQNKTANQDYSTPSVDSILKAASIVMGREAQVSSEDFTKIAELMPENGTLSLATPYLFAPNKEQDVSMPDINLTPEATMPKELRHLSADFENDLLESVSAFGKDAVNKGKVLIARELNDIGFKNAQVRFSSENSDGVIYSAQLNTQKGKMDIEVLAEMNKLPTGQYVPLSPSFFSYNGMVDSFDGPSLKKFILSLPEKESLNAKSASMYKYMNLKELKNEILIAVAGDNYDAANDILENIQSRFTEEDYRNCVADYNFILTAKVKKSNQHLEKRCSKEIPAGKGSVFARCGHYLVSMDKVIIDEKGDCQLKVALERERLNPIEETGASISTSKIFLT